jgi:membrane associated rhomboid family serine protease
MVLPLGDLHPTRIVPIVTYTLIAINVVVFLLQEQRGEAFTLAYAATPWEISHDEDIDQPVLRRAIPIGMPINPRIDVIPHAPCPIPVRWTLLTSLFLHGNWMHLLGNMLYLWIVGDNVEEVLGSVRYLIVYLACGLMGSIAQILVNPNSLIPTLGASGAIAGIMGAYVVWFPHNRIRVLLFRIITELPAVIVIGGWILIQIWSGAGAIGKTGEEGGVAYLAHVGGALTGILVAILFYNHAQYIKMRDEGYQGWHEVDEPGY